MANRRRKDLTDIEKAREFGRQSLEDAETGKLKRSRSGAEVAGFAAIPYLDGSMGGITPDNTPSVAIDTPIIPQNRDISWEAEQRARALEANRQMLNYYHDVMREENASRNAQRRREAGQSEVLGSRRAPGESTLTNAAKNEIAGLEQKRDRLLKYDGVYGNDRKAQAIQNQIDEIKNNGHASNENYLVSRNRYDSLMSDSELANDIDKLTQIIYNPRRAGGNASANAVSQRLTEMDAQDYIDSLSSKYGLNEDELRDMALTRHSEDRYSRSDEYSENLYDFAKRHPKLGEAASVLDTFGNSVEGAYNLAAGTLTNDNRYLSDAFRDTKQGLRQGVIDSHKTGLGRTVSQLKMGLEDLGLGVLTGNAPLMLAGQTANEAMLDAVENGQTARRGALYGGLSGAADYYMNKVGLDECQFDPENRIVECPAGRKPIYKSFKKGKGRAVFFKKICDECPMKDQCRSRKCGKQNREFRYDDSDLRTRSRRMFESSDEFRKLYSKRSAIEGLNGRLKQFTPLRRLRIRGRTAVFHSIYAILAMHNIMQAVRHAKIQAKKAAAAALFRFFHRKLFFFQQNPLSHAA